MGHAVHIESKEQYVRALRVLNFMRGTWQGVGPSTAPILLVTDEQFEALVEAGVVPNNGKEAAPRGKKTTSRKPKR